MDNRNHIHTLTIWIVLLGLISPTFCKINLHVSIPAAGIFKPVEALTPDDLYYNNTGDPGAVNDIEFIFSHDDFDLPSTKVGAVRADFGAGSFNVSGCDGGLGYASVGFSDGDGGGDMTVLESPGVSCKIGEALYDPEDVPAWRNKCRLKCKVLAVTGTGPVKIDARFETAFGGELEVSGRSRKSWGAIVWDGSPADMGTVEISVDGKVPVGAAVTLNLAFDAPAPLKTGSILVIASNVDAATGDEVAGNKPRFYYNNMAKYASATVPVMISYLADSGAVIIKYTGKDTIPSGETIKVTLFNVKAPRFFGDAVSHPVRLLHPTDGGIAVGVTGTLAATDGELSIEHGTMKTPFKNRMSEFELIVKIPGALYLMSHPMKLANTFVGVNLPYAIPVPKYASLSVDMGDSSNLPIGNVTDINTADNYIEIGLKTDEIDVMAGNVVIKFPYESAHVDYKFGPLEPLNKTDTVRVEFFQMDPTDGKMLLFNGSAEVGSGAVDLYTEESSIQSVTLSSRITNTVTDLEVEFDCNHVIPVGAIIDVVFPFTNENFDFAKNPLTASWGDVSHGTLSVSMAPTDVQYKPKFNFGTGDLDLSPEERTVVRLTRTGSQAPIAPGAGTNTVIIRGLVHAMEPSRSAHMYHVRIREADKTPISRSLDSTFNEDMSIVYGTITNAMIKSTSSRAGAPADVSISFKPDFTLRLAPGRRYKIAVDLPQSYTVTNDTRANVEGVSCPEWGECEAAAEVSPPLGDTTFAFEPKPSNTFFVEFKLCMLWCMRGEVEEIAAGDLVTLSFADNPNPVTLGTAGNVDITMYELMPDGAGGGDVWLPIAVIHPDLPRPKMPAVEMADLESVEANPSVAVINKDTNVRVFFETPVQFPLGASESMVRITLPDGYSLKPDAKVVNITERSCLFGGICTEKGRAILPKSDCFPANRTCDVWIGTGSGESPSEWALYIVNVRTPTSGMVVGDTIVQLLSSVGDVYAEGTGSGFPFSNSAFDPIGISLATIIDGGGFEVAVSGAQGNVSFAFRTLGATISKNATLVLTLGVRSQFVFNDHDGAVLVSEPAGIEYPCAGSIPGASTSMEGIPFICVFNLLDKIPAGAYRWVIMGAKNPSVAGVVEGASVYVVDSPHAPIEIIAGAKDMGAIGDHPELLPAIIRDAKVINTDPEKGEKATIRVEFTTPAAIPVDGVFILEFPDITANPASLNLGYANPVIGHFPLDPDPVTGDRFEVHTSSEMPIPIETIDAAQHECDLQPDCKGFSYNEDDLYVVLYTDETNPIANDDPSSWVTKKRITTVSPELEEALKFNFDSIGKVVTSSSMDGKLTVSLGDGDRDLVWKREDADTAIPAGTKVVLTVNNVRNPTMLTATGKFPRVEVLTPDYEPIALTNNLEGMDIVSTPADKIHGEKHGNVIDYKFRMKTLNLEGVEFKIAEWRIDMDRDVYLNGKLLNSLTKLEELKGKGPPDTVPEITKTAMGAVHLFCRDGEIPYDVTRSVPSWVCDTCPIDENKAATVDPNTLKAAAAEKMFGAFEVETAGDDFEELDFGEDTTGSIPDDGYSQCKQNPPPEPPSVTVKYPPTRMLLVAPPYEEPLLGMLPSFGGTVSAGGKTLNNRINLLMIMSAHAPPNSEAVFFEEDFFEDCSIMIPGYGKGQNFEKDPKGNMMKTGAVPKEAGKYFTDKDGRPLNLKLDLSRDALDIASGDAFAGIPAWTSTDCNYAKFVEVSEQIEDAVLQMNSAVGMYQSRALRTLLSSLTTSENYLACVKLVDSLVTDSIDKKTATIRDSTACFETDTKSQAYKDDPCCNKRIASKKCCAPRDVEITYLANAEPFYLNIEKHCNLDLYCDLANRWLPAYVQDKEVMVESPATGCSAQRASLVTDELWDSLRTFESACLEKIFGPDGWSGPSCKRDTDCLTSCHKSNPLDETGKCKVPLGPEGVDVVLLCFLDNMTPLVESKLSSIWGVSRSGHTKGGDLDTTSQFYQSFKSKVTSLECVGPSACDFRGGFAGGEFNEFGEWVVNTKSVNTDGCTQEQACNWDKSVSDKDVCESPPGKTGVAKTHFCRACDGPFCQNLEFAGIADEASCGTEWCGAVGRDCANDHAECTQLCDGKECANEAECLSSGESICSDEEHFSTDPSSGLEVGYACWAPPAANPLTGAAESCLATQFEDKQGGQVYTWPDPTYGCLFPDLDSKNTCLDSGIDDVQWIERATNQTFCENKVKACWDDAKQVWTLHDEAECTACSREWKSVYSWKSPEWAPLKSVPTEWTERKWESVNKLEPSLDLTKVKKVIDNLIDSVVGGFFKSEAKCRVSLVQVQKNIVCACAGGNANRTDECVGDIAQDLGSTFINKDSASSGKGVGAADVARGNKLTGIPSTMLDSAPNLGLSKKLMPSNAFALCSDTSTRAKQVDDTDERARFHALRRPSLDTSSFNLITDSSGNTIGQILGSGLDVTTSGSGSLSVCIETSSSITQNAAYTTLGYGGADSAGYPSGVLSNSVTKDADGRLCGTLDTSGTYFPVAYDASYTPPTPTPTPVVEPTREVNVTIAGNSNDFTAENRTQFLKDLSNESKAPLSALSIASITDVNVTVTTTRAASASPSSSKRGLHALATTIEQRMIILVNVAPTSSMTSETAMNLVSAIISNPASPLVTSYGLVPTTSTPSTGTTSPTPPGPPAYTNVTLKMTLPEFTALKRSEFEAAIATRIGIQAANVKVTAAVSSTVASASVVVATIEFTDSTIGSGLTMQASFSRDMFALIANDPKDTLTVTWSILTSAEGGSTTVPATPTPVPSPSPAPSSTATPVIDPNDPVSTIAEFDLVKPTSAAGSIQSSVVAFTACMATVLVALFLS